MSTAFKSADILLPKNADMSKWAVVACDQYTSEPEYWADVEKTVSVQDMLESKKPENAETVEEKKPDEQAKLFSDTVDELMSQMNESIDFLKQI